MEEKTLPPRPSRFNAVGFCLTAVRIWQWSSSFFAYASFSLLYDHIQRNRLGEGERMRGVQILGLVSLVYSTAVVCSVHIFKTLDIRIWRVCAVMSLPGDLTIMGIFLAKITILSFSGLPADCHGLTRDNYDGNDLIRQPADGFTTIRFGSWTHDISGELDDLCTFPRTVYGLSVAAIFSYTFSILLSVLYLQSQWPGPATVDSEKAFQEVATHDGEERTPHLHPASITYASSRPPSLVSSSSHHSPSRSPSPPQGSIRSNAPSYHSRVSHRQFEWAEAGLRGGSSNSNNDNYRDGNDSTPSSSSSSSSSRTPSSTSRTQSVGSETCCSTWGATSTTLGSDAGSIHSGISLPDSDASSIVSGGSLPPPPVPGSSSAVPPQRRWSSSTSSSYDANAFLVTDGFRPGGGVVDLPSYSSRPGSLYHETMKYEAGLKFHNCGPLP
ncbi:hypothetical protein VMCG_05687 [Cytospora schulzeri]|uniref:Uncharacterized protein n=1 Tax=Cytospora schulzeri TaxID=448051 RepID=A0A423WIF0_9PEZI|nr:hypothetical protein VMCG_05687 [Valsa malicola]